MNQQQTNKVFMIKPKHFAFNKETASNNYFQKKIKTTKKQLLVKVTQEFEDLVAKLLAKNIRVDVFSDQDNVVTPDSIFPNNWVSTHHSGKVYFYPMFAPNRRLEIRKDIIAKLQQKGFLVKEIIDLSLHVKQNLFLEGTGALVLDRINKIAYCSLSPRANEKMLHKWSKISGYEIISFSSFHQTSDQQNHHIYHTNVMMSIADSYALVCLESIRSKHKRQIVYDKLINSGKQVIEISPHQVNLFVGNALQLQNSKGEKFLVMSQTAYQALSKRQLELITSQNEIIYSNIEVIEKIGGGSVRCMIAENFLPHKQ